jgi:hypothetical protein
MSKAGKRLLRAVARGEREPKQIKKPRVMLRGSPGHDYPCVIPTVTECGLCECQELGHCRRAAAER